MEAAAAIVFTILMIIAFIVWFCFIIGFYLAMFGLFILILTGWILMLIDCLQRDFPKSEDKTIWVLVVILTGWVGALIYYLMIKRPADHLAAAQTA